MNSNNCSVPPGSDSADGWASAASVALVISDHYGVNELFVVLVFAGNCLFGPAFLLASCLF